VSTTVSPTIAAEWPHTCAPFLASLHLFLLVSSTHASPSTVVPSRLRPPWIHTRPPPTATATCPLLAGGAVPDVSTSVHDPPPSVESGVKAHTLERSTSDAVPWSTWAPPTR